ncbi:hypothetical protein Pcinc_009054 [Petrolisthes cinctipes]|uniref:Uncharacterized protein n=1 Tax=Petrolisthes cinctipes TaxID=88211 RepID=A0AAE1G5E8_PETCI|nr:hypothetical protein Pcinc_009054 [Petrolisthes cinctipes]
MLPASAMCRIPPRPSLSLSYLVYLCSGSLVTTTWEYLCAVLDPRQPTPLTARTHSMGLAYAATPPSLALPSALPPSLSLWHSPYLNQVLGTLPPSLSLSLPPPSSRLPLLIPLPPSFPLTHSLSLGTLLPSHSPWLVPSLPDHPYPATSLSSGRPCPTYTHCLASP